ncbi:hypothetical protein V2J09_002395 [Rumex salicifolius]
MGRDSSLVLCRFSLNYFILSLIIVLSVHSNGSFFARAEPLINSHTISSFNYPERTLKHYDWRYIRVDVPPSFSSVSMELESDVDLDLSQISKISQDALPLICFRDGSLPLPDLPDKTANSVVVETVSNTSISEIQGLQNTELCYPMQKRLKVTLTNEQIYPGVWYLGLFNGIGDTRTQSKMINRGDKFSYSANVSVTGCTFPNLWGQHCNQTVESLSCAKSLMNGSMSSNSNQRAIQKISCKNSVEQTCLAITEQTMYFTEIIGLAEKLIISADVIHNGTLKAYARYGSLPSLSTHDYTVNLDKGPLIIQSPKVGGWYVSVMPDNSTEELHKSRGENGTVCYSLVLQVDECPEGKAGFNCSWERYPFQTVMQKTPFESYNLPLSEKVSLNSESFALEPLLSNSSMGNQSGIAWTYFTMNVPQGATGRNMHIRLLSKKETRYEIYARFGGLPSDHVWDYFYASKINSSEGAKFFMVNNSTKEIVDFYMLYIREGTWNFAIKHPYFNNVAFDDETKMSISIERCPNDCSSPHGSCKNLMDESGFTVYSYCSCDGTHGGFDCSTETVSHKGLVWQSICLIASNAAAILPAYYALRQKSYAEWVIYTCSGISSGLYHACDVGTWCVLNFHVLQFMDFWLSFMAVVSTFVHMAAIDDGSKRTIHAAVSILTAMLAVNGPTRSSNIVIVFAIGSTGLLIGWLIELSSKYKSMPLSKFCNFKMFHGREPFLHSLGNMLRSLQKYFRWGFIIAGLLAFAMAAVSWTLETTQSYWIWHSLWHISIYTCSFLFLCSKVSSQMIQRHSSGSQSEQQYELTRQDSIPRAHSLA